MNAADAAFNVICILIISAWLWAIHMDVRETRDALREMLAKEKQ